MKQNKHKNSARQTVEAFQEWLAWGKTQYPELRKKRKKRPEQNPLYSYFNGSELND
jgi:hypothetical protein